jgi:hypothetical protein
MTAPVWQCHGCGEFRDDEWISVAHHKIAARGPLPPIQLNARYCNDRTSCLVAAAKVLETWRDLVRLTGPLGER